MADVSIIKTPNNNAYNIKDSTARADITNLKDKVSTLEASFKITKETTWAQGTLNTNTGNPATSNTRIRSDFYKVTVTPVYASPAEGYKVGARIYNSDQSFSGTGVSFSTSTTEMPVTKGQYIRLLAAYTDDRNITPTDFNGVELYIDALGALESLIADLENTTN